MRRLIGAAALLLLSMGFPRDANACSCVQSGPPCQDFFEADAVFVGTVGEITPIEGSGHHPQWSNQRVRLVVDRALRGVNGKAVELMTEPSGGQCGYPFRAGEKYVVYAYRYKGDAQLWASICSRTRPVSEADEDLRYFGSLPAAGSGARVYGTVNNGVRLLSKNPVIYEPVESVQILLQGSAGLFSAVSDDEGEYAISGLPSGQYELKVVPPAPFSRRHLERKVTLRDPGCVLADFFVRYDNRVSGSLVAADGGPASGIAVELRPAEHAESTQFNLGTYAKSDARGFFEFADVSPGRYVVGVGLSRVISHDIVHPRTLHPGVRIVGDASIIEIGEGTRVDLQTFRLPPALKAVQLTGAVFWPDGTAAAEVIVSRRVVDPSGTGVGLGSRTDADGRFTFTLYEGLRYVVSSSHSTGDEYNRRYFEASTDPFIASGRMDPLRLVLSPKQ